jgi:hypothetical protein
MDKCNAESTCTGFSWQLGTEPTGIPKDGDVAANNGYCYFRSVTGASGDTLPYYDSGRDFAARLPAGATTVPASTAATPAPTFDAAVTPWIPNADCTKGGSNSTGGRYTDRFGAVWELRCQSGLDVIASEVTLQSNQGIYGCWKGCNNRPGCSSFAYAGEINSSMCRDHHYLAVINANTVLSGSD